MHIHICMYNLGEAPEESRLVPFQPTYVIHFCM